MVELRIRSEPGVELPGLEVRGTEDAGILLGTAGLALQSIVLIRTSTDPQQGRACCSYILRRADDPRCCLPR